MWVLYRMMNNSEDRVQARSIGVENVPISRSIDRNKKPKEVGQDDSCKGKFCL